MAKDFAEIERMEAEAGLQATDGELTSEAKQSLTSRFVAQWEKKNARRAIRGGVVSTMALTLAACGDGDDNTDQADVDDDNEIDVTTIKSDLTNGSDNVDAGGGDDMITAGLVYTPGGNDRVNSLQDEDVIDGGAGADTLDVTLGNAGDNGDTTIAPTITNVETLKVAFTGSGDNAVNQLDLQNSTGFDALEISDISFGGDEGGTATVDNVQDVLSTISISNSGEDDDSVTVSFDDGVLDGTADVLGLTVDDVDVNNLEIDGEDGEGYETINVTASGELEVDDLEVDEAETLDFAGAGDVTISAMTLSAGHLSTLDASDATGDYDVDLGTNDIIEAQNSDGSGTEIGFDYDGSQGADTIRVDEDSLSDDGVVGEDDGRNDNIDGGAGNDTLLFTVDANTALDLSDGAAAERNGLVEDEHNVTSIETVRINAADTNNGADTIVAGLDASLIGGLTTVELRNSSGDDDADDTADFDIINLGTAFNGGAGVIDVFHAVEDGDAENAASTDVRAHLADASGDDDTVTVHIETAANTTETFNFTLDVDGNDADATVLDDDAVENLTIVDNDTEDNTVAINSIADHDDTLTLSGGRADDEFTITGTVVATTVAATAQASDVDLSLGTADQDVNMGSGDDTLNFAQDQLTDDDDVSGGAGSDTIATGFGADSDSDLNISGVEQINLDADANVTVDVSESDEITTVGIVSNDAAANVTGGDENDVITLNADAVATIDYVGEPDDNDADVYNALTIDEEDDTSPEEVTVNVDDAGTAAATIGVLTLDSDTTSLTVNNEDDNDANATTFSGIVASGLTTLKVTDGFNTVGNAAEETVIDLDDTTALGSVENEPALDATGALGGVDVTLEALADGASIDLRNPDDAADDANDALTITFNGDTGADDVTINGGAGEETITITNGDLDDLEINAGAGNDIIDLDGAGGNNIEINGGAGDDEITGTDDDEEISGGAGDDTITGGAGADQIATGAGDDTVIMTDAPTTDVVSDFAVGANADHFDLDLSDLEDATTGLDHEGNAAVDFVEVNDASPNAAGAISFQTIDDDNTAAGADATGFLLDGDFADLDAALTAMEDGGALSITHGAEIEANDSFVFVFDDGTDSFLATATFIAADDNDAAADAIADDNLEGDILTELTGVADATTLTNANVDFIA